MSNYRTGTVPPVPVLAVPGAADTVFDYSYLDGSSLVSGYTATPEGATFPLTVFYSFEDNRDAKTQALNEFGTNLVSLFDYSYDELMRRTQRIDTRGAGIPACTTNDFDYNARSELTDADMGSELYDYNYDLIGNRIQMTEDGSQTTDYAANSLNQYTTITNGGASSPSEPSYDFDGNLTNDAVNAYTWNAENRLIKVEPVSPTNHSNRLEFQYDSQGRRISKNVYTYDSSTSNFLPFTSHKFLYDGWNLIAEVRSQGSEVSTNLYTWGIDLSGTLQGAGGVGGLLSVIKGGANSPSEPFFPAYDANGNITDYVTTNGTIAAHFEYDPYGNITKASGLMPNAFSHRFSTKYWDAETQLSYYGYRYYSPENGRWLNRDPIGEKGGVNLYEFAINSPCVFIDPLGLRSCSNADSTAASSTTATSAHDSVQKVLNQTNPKSVKKDIEYCGLICKYCKNGTSIYYATRISGDVGGCTPGNAPCGKGEEVSEWWHTHGGVVDMDGDGVDDRGYDSNRFSDPSDNPQHPENTDTGLSDLSGVPANVGTPDGSWDRYDPNTGQITQEGTCAN